MYMYSYSYVFMLSTVFFVQNSKKNGKLNFFFTFIDDFFEVNFLQLFQRIWTQSWRTKMEQEDIHICEAETTSLRKHDALHTATSTS